MRKTRSIGFCTFILTCIVIFSIDSVLAPPGGGGGWAIARIDDPSNGITIIRTEIVTIQVYISASPGTHAYLKINGILEKTWHSGGYLEYEWDTTQNPGYGYFSNVEIRLDVYADSPFYHDTDIIHVNVDNTPYYEQSNVNIRNLGNGGQNDKLRQGATVEIIAKVTASGVTAVKYQIDSESEQPLTQFGSTNQYVGSWDIDQNLGSHTVRVNTYTETSFPMGVIYYDSVTVEVVSGYIAALFYEVDYIASPCPQPSDSISVFNYWKNYWDARAINVTYEFNDSVPMTGEGWDASDNITSPNASDPGESELEAIEGQYNDHHFAAQGTISDQANGNIVNNGVFGSQEKWLLWGTTTAGGYGLTCTIPRLASGDPFNENDPPVWVLDYGNYILICTEACDDYETQHNVANEGLKVQVLMHETGHSIGIVQYKLRWSIDFEQWIRDERYDPDKYSVMALVAEGLSAKFTSHWYYSHEYWDYRKMGFY